MDRTAGNVVTPQPFDRGPQTASFSRVVESIEPALSIEVNQMVYDLKRGGQDVTTLSLGEAFFDIPLFDFNRLDVAKGYHYSDTQGLPELRDKIATYYRE